MPQQLIYTSAPQGVDVGRSGYCTVARSSTMGESLVQRLEQFSYYERLSEHGGEAERTVFIFRNIDIRGKAYHVLSRIKDAPADYTGRTNFIAQHLVFTPNEVANMPTPAVLLNHWSGWKDNWEQEPRLFESESWAELEELTKRTYLPAKHWLSETADSGRAAGLLGLNAGVFTAHDFKPKLILELLSESLELLQLEGPNWRSLAWQHTFSVGCQPQDNPADFRWKFLTSGLPFESSVTQGRAPLELRKLRAPSNSQQVQFAQKGPSPPQFTRLPRAGEAIPLNEGETLILDGEAQSLPGPSIYRWYRVEKDNVTLQEIDGAHGAKLETPNIPRGKLRYKVRAWDSVTDQYAESPLIVVEVKEKLKVSNLTGRHVSTPGHVSPVSPSSQGSKTQSERKGRPPLGLNRTQNTYRPRDDGGDEQLEIANSFFQNHGKQLCWAVCLCGFVWVVLFYLDFSKPHFAGMKGKADWWHTKLFANPRHFQDDKRITPETQKLIKDFLDPDSKKSTKRPQNVVLLKIVQDLEMYHASRPPSQPPTPPKSEPAGPAISPGSKTINTPVNVPLSVIHTLLSEKEWDSLQKQFDRQQIPITTERDAATQASRKAEAALTEAKTALEQATDAFGKAKQSNSSIAVNEANSKIATSSKRIAEAAGHLAASSNKLNDVEKRLGRLNITIKKFHTQRAIANSIGYSPPWPCWDTNDPPTLTWDILAKQSLVPNSGIKGVWATDGWNFNAADWSLKLSTNSAVYMSALPIARLVEIAKPEDAAKPSKALRLLLFSANTNLSFNAKIDGDNLVASDELRKFLGGLVLHKSHSIRLVANYPPFKPTTNSLEEVYIMVSNPPWKLMITEQLAKQVTQLEKLEATRNALSRLDKLWEEVKQNTGKALLEGTFSEAVDASSPESTDSQNRTRMERQFWHAFNRLVKVAVFFKNDANKTRQFQDMTSDEAHRQLDVYFSQKEADEYFKDKMKPLITDLDNVKRLWIGESSEFLKSLKHFSEVGTNLDAAIEKLRAGDGKIDSAKLRVDLQFQASETTWLTITRLDTVAKP